MGDPATYSAGLLTKLCSIWPDSIRPIERDLWKGAGVAGGKLLVPWYALAVSFWASTIDEFKVWNFGCAFAQDEGQMLAFRFLSGFGGSATLTVRQLKQLFAWRELNRWHTHGPDRLVGQS